MRKSILLICFLFGLSQLTMAITYTTTGNNKWTPTKPGNNFTYTDQFVINHSVSLSGITLESGGSITINSGGDLSLDDVTMNMGSNIDVLAGGNLDLGGSVLFNLGSSFHLHAGGSTSMSQVNLDNYSIDFVIDGDLATNSGMFINHYDAIIDYNYGATWTMNQLTLQNFGSMNLLSDADWQNGSVEFLDGLVVINEHMIIKNVTLSNSATIEGVGQIEVANGTGTFTSTGTINNCTGNACIPPSTIGSTTYLGYHSTTDGNTMEIFDGGNIPPTSCTTTLQALVDLVVSSDMVIGDLILSPNVLVTVQSGVTLTICQGLTNEGNLLVENTGSLLQTAASDLNEGSGDYTLEREGGNNTLAYNSWSSPVANASISEVFANINECDVFCFDPDIQSWKYDYPLNYQTTCLGNNVTFGSGSVVSGGDGNMDIGRGYFIPGDMALTRSFLGQVNNASYNVPVSITGLGNKPYWDFDDWNLLGNPYPSAIDLAKLYNQNSGIITGDFYFWVDDNTQGEAYNQSNDYAVYNEFGSTSANGSVLPTQFVAMGQGFWVYALASSNVTFNNSMRVAGNNQSFFKKGDEKVIVRINVTNDANNFSQTAFGYSKTSTDMFDMGQDAPKRPIGLSLPEPSLIVGSMLDTNVLVIQAFEEVEDFASHVIPIYLKTKNAGKHTFSINDEKGVKRHIDVLILDQLTGEVVDLRTQDYTVTLAAGEYTSRFSTTVLNTGAPTGIEENIDSGNEFIISQNQHGVLINSANTDNRITSLKIYNVLGQEIARYEDINSAHFQWGCSSISSGTYILKVEFINGNVYSKKVILTR